jgi:hypothetical protein
LAHHVSNPGRKNYRNSQYTSPTSFLSIETKPTDANPNPSLANPNAVFEASVLAVYMRSNGLLPRSFLFVVCSAKALAMEFAAYSGAPVVFCDADVNVSESGTTITVGQNADKEPGSWFIATPQISSIPGKSGVPISLQQAVQEASKMHPASVGLEKLDVNVRGGKTSMHELQQAINLKLMK